MNQWHVSDHKTQSSQGIAIKLLFFNYFELYANIAEIWVEDQTKYISRFIKPIDEPCLTSSHLDQLGLHLYALYATFINFIFFQFSACFCWYL